MKLDAEQKTQIATVAMICATVVTLALLIICAPGETPEERVARMTFEREMQMKEMEVFMRLAPFIAKTGNLPPDF